MRANRRGQDHDQRETIRHRLTTKSFRKGKRICASLSLFYILTGKLMDGNNTGHTDCTLAFMPFVSHKRKGALIGTSCYLLHLPAFFG
ncbi:hypothetical protein EMCRGX_G022010 [Ephydatia muelleri]